MHTDTGRGEGRDGKREAHREEREGRERHTHSDLTEAREKRKRKEGRAEGKRHTKWKERG